MNIIAKTLGIVNPNETLIDVCDQPVYELTKQIQWQYLDLLEVHSTFPCLVGCILRELCSQFIVNSSKVVD